MTTCAVGVRTSTVRDLRTGPGGSPRAALHAIKVIPIPHRIAKEIVTAHHYLGSLPGATKLCFGVFVGLRLLGAITLGAGPTNGHNLVAGARTEDYLCLSRLWLSDLLPKNSESRILAIVARLLTKHTNVRFLLAYADPSVGHVGTIYQAAGWDYVGESEAMPLYDLGDGHPRHSRSVSHRFGTHSIRYLTAPGINVQPVSQSRKHRYVKFLTAGWDELLNVSVLPYPKKECDL